jgi:adenosylcobinamide-phosphate synthase
MILNYSLTLLALSLALILDALIGDPERLYRRIPHPVAVMGRLIAFLDRRWNSQSGGAAARIISGACATLVVVAFSGVIGMALVALLRLHPLGWVIEGVLMAVMIAQRSLFDHVRHVSVALIEGGVAAGRASVARIVGRDTSELDEGGISRGAIESLAENFSDGVVAPVFWGAIFGLPGILAYKALNTADSMIGHRTPRHLHFGSVAARLDDVANYIPARLAAVLICLAGGETLGRGVRVMGADAAGHRSVNAGYPEAAMAGVVGVRLAGPRRYAGERAEEPWLGAALRDPEQADIETALSVFIRACVIQFILVASATGVVMFIA